MGLKHLEDVTYFRLNNEINRPINGQIMLHKDKEALEAFFKENVEPNTKQFSSITEKIEKQIKQQYKNAVITGFTATDLTGTFITGTFEADNGSYSFFWIDNILTVSEVNNQTDVSCYKVCQ